MGGETEEIQRAIADFICFHCPLAASADAKSPADSEAITLQNISSTEQRHPRHREGQLLRTPNAHTGTESTACTPESRRGWSASPTHPSRRTAAPRAGFSHPPAHPPRRGIAYARLFAAAVNFRRGRPPLPADKAARSRQSSALRRQTKGRVPAKSFTRRESHIREHARKLCE